MACIFQISIYIAEVPRTRIHEYLIKIDYCFSFSLVFLFQISKGRVDIDSLKSSKIEDMSGFNTTYNNIKNFIDNPT